jgi:Uma2 family endonuclease
MTVVLGTNPPRHKGGGTMTMLVLDPAEERRLKRERARTGADRFDEVWDGVYMVAPLPDNEHQFLVIELAKVIHQTVGAPNQGITYAGVNVSDREKTWKRNVRCPDVAVFLKGTKAKDCDTHWLGGPDFAVEIVSPNDRSRDKLDFYAKVGVRELLILDRKPWRLELYRLTDGQLELAGVSTPNKQTVLSSDVLALAFALEGAKPRPRLRVKTANGKRSWSIQRPR